MRWISCSATFCCHGSMTPKPRKTSGFRFTPSATCLLGTGVNPVMVSSVVF